MRNSLDPIGILLANTLPAGVLLFLYGSMVAIIHPLLPPESLHLWKAFSFALVGIALSSTVYAIVLQRMGQVVHFAYGLLVFASYVVLLWSFTENVQELMPRDIPRWMVPEDSVLYAFRLLAIPLAHALFIIVVGSLQNDDRGKPLRDILIAVAIPLVCYLFVQVVEPWRIGVDFERHVWIVFMIVLVVLFLFFLFRGIIALARRTSPSNVVSLILRFVFGLVLPLLGLAINNGLFKMEVNGVFGDLGHWGFYVVAVLNGLVVFWGSSTDPRIRLLQFVLRAIGFSYVLYFFVLFVPFLPLSIVAILAIGVGFLLLAPVLLFIVQGIQLLNDFRFLKEHRSTGSLVAVLCFGLLILPAIITGRYIHQRTVLHGALAYVYQSDPRSTPKPINSEVLESVLDQVDNNKGSRMWRSSHTPFLTPWYNYVVLDNLSVSDEKMGHLRSIFLDDQSQLNPRRRWRTPNNEVRLDTATARPTYDPVQQAWRTWVDLSMTNNSSTQGEYVTTFDLPAGAWISDEYLMIGDREVKGILAEKKAATWVYQQIVRVRQDPSLTRYVGPGRIQLRVFPFAAGEQRRAGFEVLHKEPTALRLDGIHLQLGDNTHGMLSAVINSTDGHVAYIPSVVKSTLPTVVRTPRIHLLVDGTERNRPVRDAVLSRIGKFVEQQALEPDKITLHIVDAYTASHPWNELAAEKYKHHVGRGGFFSDRAIRKVLVEACEQPTLERPVIVLVPSFAVDSNEVPGIWLEELEDLASCVPEGSAFFLMDGSPLSQRTFTDPAVVVDGNAYDQLEIASPTQVLAWPTAEEPSAYLPANSSASIAFMGATVGDATKKQRTWKDALSLEGSWRQHLLHPEGGTKAWRALVKGSFQAQILTPVTAWMCLEDDAQRNALMRKQEEMLNSNAALDASDETVNRMSEPGFLWMLLPVLLALWVRRKG